MSRQMQPSMPTDDSPMNLEYNCESCPRDFEAKMAHKIEVHNEKEADIMCPWCKTTASYHPPDEINRPPAIVDSSTKTEDGCTVARMFFEGGSWLQYRETAEGRVREEMFNEDGKQIESFNAEIEHEDFGPISELYDPPEAYLRSAVKQYEEYTVRGIRIQKPHIYAVLINGH